MRRFRPSPSELVDGKARITAVGTHNTSAKHIWIRPHTIRTGGSMFCEGDRFDMINSLSI